MYEIDERFRDYYEELEPKIRLEILNSLPEDKAVNFLHELYSNRYSDHEGKGRKNIDWWLWRCICLQILFGRGKLLRRFRDKEVKAIINELKIDDTDEEHKAFLYHEYRNLARRYLSTCKSSNYASRFMGFRQASDDEKVYKACADVWQMSAGIAKSAELEGKMQLWIEAFHDELIKYSPLCKDEYERLNS